MSGKRNKSIVLIGFMGSGKTTVGLKLSYRLKMPVLDTDKLIEKRMGCSISELFAKQGEEFFRTKETELLKELGESSFSRIISVGGGTPVRPENRELLRKCGTVVYLRVCPETVYERIKDDGTRPLLQCEDPLQRIKELLAARQEAYKECAHVVLDVDGRDVADIVEEIAKYVEIAAKEERKRMKLLVINGPNLNFLGIREKNIYGTQDYQYLLEMIGKKAKSMDCEVEVFQSNHEGAIIDRIQDAYFDGTQGIVINPGAYTHYSYAIHDALASIRTMPKVEIHISDITKREDFRKVSVTAPACDKQIYGHGLEGYLMAMEEVYQLAEKINEKGGEQG